jgi:acyl dehydratase
VNGGWFEDWTVGDRFRHARGKTVTEFEVATLCHLVMNTAQAHFNEHLMASGSSFAARRVAFGGITASIVIGLATPDTTQHAAAEVGLDAIRLRKPVGVGDTLYALTEVVAKDDDASTVTFRHWGVNQDDKVVFEGERRVLIKRRSHWADK